MSVTLRGKLPAGDADGLQKAASRLRQDPDTMFLVVMRVDLNRIIRRRHNDDDPVIYELSPTAIELIDEPGDYAAVSSIMNLAYERRTGNVALPFGADLHVIDDTGDE